MFVFRTEGARQASPGQARTASAALGRNCPVQEHAESVRPERRTLSASSRSELLAAQGGAHCVRLPWAFLPCTFGAQPQAFLGRHFFRRISN
jgi:hypothetical protein